MAAARYSAILLERRRQLGITLGKAARDLRMKERILQAFEEGDFASIPSNGYAQGMLASYARYLGLDDSAVVRQFNEDLYVYEHGNNERRRRSREQVRSSYSDRGAQRAGVASRSRSAAPQGSYARSQQGQQYSQRVPQQGYPSQQQRNPYIDGSERFYGQSQRIETRPVESGYTDDMQYGQTTSPYEAANSVRGRVSSRNIANVQRPNVDRRRPQPGRHPQRPKTLLSNENMVIGLGVLVAVLLTIIIVMSVSSCVNTAAGESSSAASATVPVSTAESDSSSTSSSTNSDSSSSNNSSTTAAQTAATKSGTTSSDEAADEKTEVTVTVADNSVSWVEIVVDGKSVVAESVTGPWTQTYDPTQSMSIQVGDTSAVTVTKNGENQSFDAKTSGLGTITIKVPQKTTTTTDGTSTDSASTNSTATDTDSSQSGTSTSASGSTSSSTGTSTSGTTSATTNGASATSTKSASTTTSKA